MKCAYRSHRTRLVGDAILHYAGSLPIPTIGGIADEAEQQLLAEINAWLSGS